jgi:flagellar protein FliJ
LVRRKQFEASEKQRKVTLLRTLISDFDNVIADFNGQIAAEENHTRIKDTAHPAYSTLAAKRRQNLVTSVAHMKSLLEVAIRELDERCSSVISNRCTTARHNQACYLAVR